MKKIFRVFLVALFLFSLSVSIKLVFYSQKTLEPEEESCTVGAAMGNATIDGRPITWKNRDGSGFHRIWYVQSPSGQYSFLAMGNADGVKMGVNEKGLSMQNALCTGMDTGGYKYANNTAFKIYTLTKTKSVAEVRQAIIEDTSGQKDHWGPPAICANFGDAFGYATHFELGGTDYFEYNPTNANRLKQFPKQIVTRANTPHKNRDHTDDATTGGSRYVRARELLVQYATNNQLSIANWFRQISRDGHGTSNTTISRTSTRGVMFVHGVNNGEDARIVTAWASLGRPDYTILIPAWVAQKNNLSSYATTTGTSSLSSVSEKLYNKRDTDTYDAYINGLYKPVEDNIFEVVDLVRSHWFKSGFNLQEATSVHMEAVETAWQTMNSMSQGSGRNLNVPPALTSLNASVNGSTVNFNANASDNNGSITSYNWDFGDGSSSSAQSPSHNYSNSGTYLVRVRVTDNQGARNSKWKYVTVSGGPPTSCNNCYNYNNSSDGNVDIQDILFVANRWGTSNPDTIYDIFCSSSNPPDGTINILDVQTVANKWNAASCTP